MVVRSSDIKTGKLQEIQLFVMSEQIRINTCLCYKYFE